VIKRLRWIVIGFVLGLGASWTVMQRIRRVARRYVPAEVADRWGGTVRAAVDEGRSAMRTREAELRLKAASEPAAGK
jgi:hypothetical protein